VIQLLFDLRDIFQKIDNLQATSNVMMYERADLQDLKSKMKNQ